MTTLTAIRTAIKTTIGTATGMRVYDVVPDAPVMPCACVVPASADFATAMARAVDRWEFDILVLVAVQSDSGIAQATLDAFISGHGTTSIRQAIFNSKTLGISGASAFVSAMENYGIRHEAVGVDNLGAVLKLSVLMAGSA